MPQFLTSLLTGVAIALVESLIIKVAKTAFSRVTHTAAV